MAIRCTLAKDVSVGCLACVLTGCLTGCYGRVVGRSGGWFLLACQDGNAWVTGFNLRFVCN